MDLDELKDCSYKPSKTTREQKELLLKDLCVRLPYGVKLLHTPTNEITNLEMIGNDVIDGNIHDLIENFKPYLFPLSNITKEQWKECQSLMIKDSYGILYYTIESYDYLYKNHIDIRGLIPMGLANDATGLNIY